jgi:acyl carrier protein
MAGTRRGAKVATTNGETIGRDEVLEIVRTQLSEILEIDPGQIAETASFSEDLNADSLALIELVEALEEELRERVANFRIDDEDLEDLRTVRDAVDYVTAKLEVA